ncbi:peptidyl-tRNA hydrolase [Parelusimicrobium proximum]|uniref:aminoacyl-tRNA hydrolase n=1 Tax=Parelusimicrobium proximum TaxID=3228953 RepID=UPI003D16F3AD
MSSNVYLISGLGNPGPEYSKTRHNAGFMLVDKLAEKLHLKFEKWKNIGEYAKFEYKGKTVYLLKPLTYMNLSGDMVQSISAYYKIPRQNMLICFDDLSLNTGDIRIRLSGSAGGQKGMKNIIDRLGSQDIARLRIGVGPKPERFDTSDFVLSNFTKAEAEALESALVRAADAALMCVEEGVEKAMNKYN